MISLTVCPSLYNPHQLFLEYMHLWSLQLDNLKIFFDVIFVSCPASFTAENMAKYQNKQSTCSSAIINLGFYYLLLQVSISLMIGGIEIMEKCGYKPRAFITRERLLMERVR